MTPYTQPRSNQKQIYIHNLDMIIGPMGAQYDNPSP